MSEIITLDPAEETDNRTELAINTGAITVAADGIDWGNAEVQQYQAQQERGQTAVDIRYPNRTVTVPLTIRDTSGTSFQQARRNLHSKIGRLQREGGVLKRILSTGGTFYADIVNATLTQGDQWMADHRETEPGARLVLECAPDFYGPEVTLSDHITTTATELIWTETNIGGDYPGRVRIVVDNDEAAQVQRGLIWGVRSRYYTAGTTAKMEYDANDLELMGGAIANTNASATGGTEVFRGTISAEWAPVLGGRLPGTTYMTHVGTYRAFARARTTTASEVQARLSWSVGDQIATESNDAVPVPNSAENLFHIIDLGDVRIDPPPVGTHRWYWQVEAKGTDGDENIGIDKVWFVNTDEGMGILRAPVQPITYANVASDRFTRTDGALTGGTADTGQVWVGAGDATDFAVAGNVMSRSATLDSNVNNGRYATLPISTATGQTVSVAVYWSVDNPLTDITSDSARWGVLARYTSATNALMATVDPSANGAFRVELESGGVLTTLSETPMVEIPVHREGNRSHFITLSVDRSGYWWASIRTGIEEYVVKGYHSTLIAASHNDGSPGIYDAYTGSAAVSRYYDKFYASYETSASPQLTEAVAYSSQSVQLTTDGMWREDSGGVAYGPVSTVYGDLPRIPPSGLSQGTVEFFLKHSRGDIYDLPDQGIDNISARVSYRPSYIFVPE
jgi:hypothetical protein